MNTVYFVKGLPMFKKSLLAAIVAFSTSATAITTEERQHYMDDFSMLSFMVPSKLLGTGKTLTK